MKSVNWLFQIVLLVSQVGSTLHNGAAHDSKIFRFSTKFYEQQAIIHSWGYRELQKHVKRNLYGNTSKQEIEETFQTKLSSMPEFKNSLTDQKITDPFSHFFFLASPLYNKE